jgi:excinuclease ABC subunit B
MYADRITNSMQRVIDETARRRKLQEAYNKEHNINPATIYKSIEEIMNTTSIADIGADRKNKRLAAETKKKTKLSDSIASFIPPDQIANYIDELYVLMRNAAKDLDFELAASLRDEIAELKERVKK